MNNALILENNAYVRVYSIIERKLSFQEIICGTFYTLRNIGTLSSVVNLLGYTIVSSCYLNTLTQVKFFCYIAQSCCAGGFPKNDS